jgi:hypothetical protein
MALASASCQRCALPRVSSGPAGADLPTFPRQDTLRCLYFFDYQSIL